MFDSADVALYRDIIAVNIAIEGRQRGLSGRFAKEVLMGILLAFAPFIAFAIVDRFIGGTAGLLTGAVVSAALLVRDRCLAGWRFTASSGTRPGSILAMSQPPFGLWRSPPWSLPI